MTGSLGFSWFLIKKKKRHFWTFVWRLTAKTTIFKCHLWDIPFQGLHDGSDGSFSHSFSLDTRLDWRCKAFFVHTTLCRRILCKVKSCCKVTQQSVLLLPWDHPLTPWPPPPTQNSLVRISVSRMLKFSLIRTWSGQKPLPLQFLKKHSSCGNLSFSWTPLLWIPLLVPLGQLPRKCSMYVMFLMGGRYVQWFFFLYATLLAPLWMWGAWRHGTWCEACVNLNRPNGKLHVTAY